MATVHEIRQRVDALRAEARTINAAAGDGALDPAAEARFAAIETEVATLRAAERRAAFVDEADRSAPGQSVSGDRHFDEFRNGVSLSAVIRAQMQEHRNTAEAGRVRELSQELARRSGRAPATGLLWDMRHESRATTTGKQGTTPNGAALVPLVQRPDQFIDVMRNNLVIERLGALVLTDLVGDVAIPRRTSTVQPVFVNENQPLPLSDTSFAQLTMKPKTAGVVSEISRNLVMQSSPSAEALVRDDQAKQMAELIDLSALMGDGTGAMPLGVIPQATALTYPLANAAPTWSDILAMGSSLETANVSPTGFVIGGGVRQALLSQPKTAAAPVNGSFILVDTDFIMTDPNTLNGLPALQTNNITAGSLLLGDWSELCVGYWSAIEVVVNEYAQDAFMKGSVLVRAVVTMDVLVRRPNAFVKLTRAVS